MNRIKHVLMGATVLILCVTLTVPQVALAAWNPNSAVHIAPKTIENSTLTVGTHLIHLSAMSDRLYEEALLTAAESSQNTVYYKSELADGDWFDVTTATTIDDITASGPSVTNETIEALYFTYHTKSDGITYDLRTNKAVSLYDIPSPYFVYELEELRPLKEQYEYLAEVRDHNTAYYKRVTQFYQQADAWVLGNASVKELDSELKYLEKYAKHLHDNNATPEETGAVQLVMDHLDASRRSIILTYLEPQLNELGGELDKHTVKAPDKLMTSIINSKEKVQKSNAKWKSKMVTDGASVIASYRYTYYNDLAKSSSNEAADVVLENILNLARIENRTIVSIIAELVMLEKELTPSATNIYLQRLRTGENSDYSTAVNDKATEEQLLSIAENDYILVCSAQAELEFFLEEMIARLDKTASVALLDARLVEAKDYYNLVPKGAFKMGSDASVAAHIVFLTRLREQVLNSDSEEDTLQADKSDLEDQMQGALNNNDLAGAGALQSRIADLDDQLNRLNENQEAESSGLKISIKNLENQLAAATKNGDSDLANRLKNQLDATNGQLSGLGGTGDGTGSGSQGNLVGELKRNGLAAVASGDKSGVDSSLNGLLGMTDSNPGLAYPAISSIHDAMVKKRDVDGDKSLGSQIDKAAKAVQDGAGQSDSGLTAEQLKMLSDWADKLLADGNPYIYIRYNDGGNEYIPCEVLCRYTGMRYLWQQSERTGTMTKKGNYYSFSVDSTEVSRDKSGIKTEQMAIAAKWQDTLHLHESYTMAKFDAEAYYIPGTKYGVLLTTEMREMLAEILGR